MAFRFYSKTGKRETGRKTDTEMTEKKTVITNRLYAAAQLTRMWPRSAKLKRASVETSFK